MNIKGGLFGEGISGQEEEEGEDTEGWAGLRFVYMHTHTHTNIIT
jgi:hypothetical protein